MTQSAERDYQTLVSLVARFGPLSGTLLVACMWPGKLYLLRIVVVARKLQRAWRKRCAWLKGQQIVIFARVVIVAPALDVAIRVSGHRLTHLRRRRKRWLQPLWTRWLIKLAFYKGLNKLKRKQRKRLCLSAILGWAILARTASGFKERKMLRALAMMRLRESVATFEAWRNYVERRRRCKAIVLKTTARYRALEKWIELCSAHKLADDVARLQRGREARKYLEDLSRSASLVQSRFRGLAGRKRFDKFRTLLASYASDKGKRSREVRRADLEQTAVREADARALAEVSAMLKASEGKWMARALGEQRFVTAAGGGGYGAHAEQRRWAIATAHRVMAQSRALVAFRRRRPPQFVCGNPCCLRAYAAANEAELCDCMGTTAVPVFIDVGLLRAGGVPKSFASDAADVAHENAFAVEEEASQLAQAHETLHEVAEADAALARKSGYSKLVQLRAVAAASLARAISGLELRDCRAFVKTGEDASLEGPPKPKPPPPVPENVRLSEARRLKALELAGEITMAELTEAEDRLYGRPPPPPSAEVRERIRAAWTEYIATITSLATDMDQGRLTKGAFANAKQRSLAECKARADGDGDGEEEAVEGEAPPAAAPPRAKKRGAVRLPAVHAAASKAPEQQRTLVGMSRALVLWELKTMRTHLRWRRHELKKRPSTNMPREGMHALFKLFDVSGSGMIDVDSALLLAREYLPRTPGKKAIAQLEKVYRSNRGVNFARFLSWANFQLRDKKARAGGWGTLLGTKGNKAPRVWLELAQRRFEARQNSMVLLSDIIKTRSRRLLKSQRPLVLSWQSSTADERAHCLPHAATMGLDGGTALGLAVLMILGLHTAYGVSSPPTGVFAASGSGWRAVRMITAAANAPPPKDHAAEAHANLATVKHVQHPHGKVHEVPRTMSTTLRNSILMLKLRELTTLHLSGELSDGAFAAAKAALLTAHRDGQESLHHGR